MKLRSLLIILFAVSLNVFSQKYIADYEIAKESVLRQIPAEYIYKARNELHIAYWHTSHGTHVFYGLSGLQDYKAGDDTLFAITEGDPTPGKLDFRDNYGTDLSIDETGFIKETRDYLDDTANAAINVIMWSWCDIAYHNVDTNYLPGMDSLINEYSEGGTKIGTGLGQRINPVTFIFMTGHANEGSNLDSEEPKSQSDLIVANCNAKQQFCLDYFSIDAHDMNDNYWEDAGEDGQSSLYGGNFYHDFQNSHTLGVDYFENKNSPGGTVTYGEHNTQHITANRKAYAMWWILARIAGWDGNLSGATDEENPTAPANLKGTIISDTEIELNWDAATDNVGVANYIIYRNDTEIDSTTELTFTDNSLVTNEVYSYYIVAEDAAGNTGERSNTIIGPTDASPSPNSDTICSSGQLSIELHSNSITSETVVFEYVIVPENPDSVMIEYDTINGTVALEAGSIISDQIINISHTGQLIRINITPYIQGKSMYDWSGATEIVEIWVEPLPEVTLIPQYDTLCDNNITSIVLTCETSSLHPVEFKYTALPDYPDSVEVHYRTNTVGLPEYFMIRDSIVNLSDTTQLVRFIVRPYTVDGASNECCTGLSDTAYIWIEPTPEVISVSLHNTLYNSNITSIQLTSKTRSIYPVEFEYAAYPDYPHNVIVYYRADTAGLVEDFIIMDSIVNPSNTSQLVRFVIRPYTVDGEGNERCQGQSDTAYVYVNPTPMVDVTLTDTIFCNDERFTFAIDSLMSSTGTIRYDLDVSYPSNVTGELSDQPYDIPSLSDSVVNATDAVQVVSYRFTAFIEDSRTGVDYGYGLDTTIYVYINPTPEIEVILPDTIVCSDERFTFAIDSLMSSTGTIRYDLDVSYPSNVTGELSDQPYDIPSLSDSLTNNTDIVQVVSYRFTAFIEDSRTGVDCGYGLDTTIYVYVNPTPEVEVTIPDTIICNARRFTFAIDSLMSSTGKVRYDLDVTYPTSVTGELSDQSFDIPSLSDSLTNYSDAIQVVSYRFTAFIEDACTGVDCGYGLDTTIRIWVEPTVKISALSDTLCSGDYTDINVWSLNEVTHGIRYTWAVTDLSGGDITGFSNSVGYGHAIDYNLHQQLFNSGPDSASIIYTITPHTIGTDSSLRCAGTPIDIRIWVEPTVEISATSDTLSTGSYTEINLGSLNNVTNSIRYTWVVTDLSGGDITGFSNNTWNGLALKNTLRQQLTNISDTIASIIYTITPYTIRNDSSLRCSGTPIDVQIWVEPESIFTLDHHSDTICNGLHFDPISIQNTNSSAWYEVELVPDNPGKVSSTDTIITGLIAGNIVSEQLNNLSDTIQRVVVKVREYLLNGADNPQYTGITDSVVIQLTPSIIIKDSARTYPRYNIRCHGDKNGAIYMYPTGGVLAFGASHYNYTNIDALNLSVTDHEGNKTWANESLTTDLYTVDGLGAGDYELEAVDFSGCSASKTTTLVEPDTFTVKIKWHKQTCPDVNEGVITLSRTGGAYYVQGFDTLGYQAPSWASSTGPIPEATDTLYNKRPGYYSVMTYDTNGCVASHDTPLFGYVTQSLDNISYSEFAGYNVSCNGNSDGTMTTRVIIRVGTFIRLYNISTNTVQVDSIYMPNRQLFTFDSLPAGDYMFAMTTDQGCVTTENVSLTEPEALQIVDEKISNYRGWNVECSNSENGYILLETIEGGRASDYSYTWTDMSNMADIASTRNANNLSSGNYQLIVDDGFCYDINHYNLTAPDSIYISYKMVDSVSCYGSNDGSILIVPSGGEGLPYTFEWEHNDELHDSTAFVYGLSAGTYFVKVKDSINCEQKDSVEVFEPNPLTINATFSDYNGYEISSTGSSDGFITINASGGSKPFAYQWSSNNEILSDVSNSLTNIPAGNYEIEVIDAHDCPSIIETFILREPEPLIVDSQDTISTNSNYSLVKEELKVYPNPCKGHVNIAISNEGGETVNIELYSITGNKINIEAKKAQANNELRIDLSKQPAGLYLYHVRVGETNFTGKLHKLE